MSEEGSRVIATCRRVTTGATRCGRRTAEHALTALSRLRPFRSGCHRGIGLPGHESSDIASALASGARLAILALLALASAHSSDAATLAGRVIGWDDEPIAGAEIVIAPGPTPAERWPVEMAPRVLARAVTDASGAFAIDDRGVEPGNHVMLVRPVGRPQHAIEGLRWAFGSLALPADVVIRIPSPATLHGIVLDESGAPVPDALVLVRASASDVSAVAQARSGGDGRFAIEGMPRLSWIQVRAETEDGAVDWLDSWMAASPTTCVALAMRPARILEGSVTHLGAPVASARVVVVGGETTEPTQSSLHPYPPQVRWIFSGAMTGSDGTFRMRVPDGMIPILAEPGWPVRVLDRGVNSVAPVSARHVLVRDSVGNAVAGAEVGWVGVPALVGTDAGGRATLPDLAGQGLVVRTADFTHKALPTAAARESVFEMPLRRRIAGWIRLAGGGSRSATVYIGESPAVATAALPNGQFRASTTSRSPSSLVIAQRPDAIGAKHWGSGESNVSVRMKRGCDVTLEAPGLPSGSVVLAKADAYALPRTIARSTAPDVIDLHGLLPGCWSIVACSEDGSVWNGSVLLGIGAPIVTKPMRRRWPLRVRCVDAEGRPIEGVRLSSDAPLAAEPEYERWSVATDASGLAVVTPEPSPSRGGVYSTKLVDIRRIHIWPHREGFVRVAPRDTDFVPGSDATYTIVMGPARAVTGTVTSPTGPVSGAEVWSDRSSSPTMTGPDGRFVIHGFAREVTARLRGFASPIAKVEEGAESPDITLALAPTRIVRGRVVHADGTPAAGIPVVFALVDSSWGARDLVTDERGEVTVSEVPAGAGWSLALAESFGPPQSVGTFADAIELMMTTPPPGRLVGRIASSRSGDSTAWVTCRGAGHGLREDDPSIDGSFEFALVEPGSYHCSAEAVGARAETRSVEVVSGRSASVTIPMRALPLRWLRFETMGAPRAGAFGFTSTVTFTTDTNGEARVPMDDGENAKFLEEPPTERTVLARGRVVGLDGLPAPDVEMDAIANGATIHDLEIASDGTFVLVVPPGSLHLLTWRVRGAVAERGLLDVTVGPDGARGLDITMERFPTGSLRVQVVDASPKPGWHVIDVEMPSLPSWWWSAPSGRFTDDPSEREPDEHGVAIFEALPIGSCKVRLDYDQVVEVEIRPFVETAVTMRAHH